MIESNAIGTRLICCQLLESYPIYKYRHEDSPSGCLKLSVLLIGYGVKMEGILRSVLTQGQLANTDLDVTVCHSNAASSYSSILKQAPYLPHFVKILLDGKEIAPSADQARLCTLRFETTPLKPEAMPQVLEAHYDCNYVIISTGNDDKNFSLAEGCAKYTPDEETVVVCLQKKERTPIASDSPLMHIHQFVGKENEKFKAQTELIAKNLHYVYAKSQNSHIDTETILKQYQDPYNYAANIEAALHIHSKLASCGITGDDTLSAAKEFSKQLHCDKTLLRTLASVEHNRWLISKCLEGYRQMSGIELIYRNGTTTHSKKDKWHCCLVPSDMSGQSALTQEDWQQAEQGIIRPELDALDKITLEIHAQCGKLSAAASDQIDSLLDHIRKTIAENTEYSGQAMQVLEELIHAIAQLRLKKASAVCRYHDALKSLQAEIRTKGRAPDLLLNLLSSVEEANLPLIEFVSCKNYKVQDEILVTQIPFCLTHKLQPVVMKALSDRNRENLLPFWRLDPSKMVFAGVAKDKKQLKQIELKFEDLTPFIRRYSKECEVSCLICVTAALKDQWKCASNVTLVCTDSWTVSGISQAFLQANHILHVNYLDVSGGHPLAARAAEQAMLQIHAGICYSENDRLCSLYNADELTFPAPEKAILVKEMFEMSGAVMNSSESHTARNISPLYRKLWALRQDNIQEWNAFADAANSAYQEGKPKSALVFYNKTPSSDSRCCIQNVSSLASKVLLPELRKWEQTGYIKNLKIKKQFGDAYTIELVSNGKKVDPCALEDFLKRFCANFQYGFCFSYSKNSYGNAVCQYRDLHIFNLPLQVAYGGKIVSIKRIILKLQELGAIRDVIISSNPACNTNETCCFRFANNDVLECLTVSGALLEYYVYYTALDETQFTDVDRSFDYMHSARTKTAENEIDIICTQGMASMFISCKARSGETMLKNANLYMYEIMLQAEHFGVNPKVCLVSPSVQMIRNNNGEIKLTSEAFRARERGVYLIGDEALANPETLGKVLTKIMNGDPFWFKV